MWSLENYTHQNRRDKTGQRHRNQPSCIAPQHHPPIDTFIVSITQPHSHGCSNDTLGSRNGHRQSRCKNNSKRRAKFHAKPTRGGMEGQPVPQVSHDIVTICSKTKVDCDATERKDPNWNG